MAFLEDPRLRQRWNQISHNAETATENAAINIWTLQHRYITPCLNSLSNAAEACCIVPCLGGREERARRRHEHERAHGRAEYSFDFYDDWYADYDDNYDRTGGILGGVAGGGRGAGGGGASSSSGGGGGIFGRWAVEDWDRLLAGTGSSLRGGEGEVIEQPARKRGMRYATRAASRRKGTEEDPTIIPSTQPIGFLGRLPFRIGGTLRYKPSAANLREHPAQRHRSSETQPLLGPDDFDDYGDAGAEYSAYLKQDKAGGRGGRGGTRSGAGADTGADTGAAAAAADDDGGGGGGAFRKRSGTTGSGTTTSGSFRSRGDLFPSDGEGEEDAIPLGDEFAVALDRMADDRSSARTRSSGEVGSAKPSAESWAGGLSRAVSRSIIVSPRRWSLDPDERHDISPRVGENAMSDGDGDDDHGPAGNLRIEKSRHHVLAPIRTTGSKAPSPETKSHDSIHHVEWGDHVLPTSPGSLFRPESRSRIASPTTPLSTHPSAQPQPEQHRVESGFVPARLPFFS